MALGTFMSGKTSSHRLMSYKHTEAGLTGFVCRTNCPRYSVGTWQASLNKGGEV